MVEIDVNKENEEEPSFSDPEDYVDDITDEDLVMDVLRQQPSKDEYEEACLMIFGIPVVGPERVGKLRTVLTKVFTNLDPDHKAHFPLTEDGGSKGCVFIEFPDKVKAEYAKGVLNGYKLDKNHVFSALLFNEARHFQKPPENWQPPKETPYNNVGDLWWWMQHPRCRDQFAVQYEKDGVPTVACYWHIKGHDPEIAGEPGKAERPSWTDTVFKWSPHGSWSFDEKFFACLKAPEKDKLEKEKKVNGISVFETETFKLVDRRHIIVENIKTFSWSPTANIISYYAECTDSLPAEFGLVQMPNQQRLRSGRIYNVADAQMFWQKSGQRLAVYTMRYSKKQMKEGGEVKYVGGCTYHIEIFEIDKKDVSLMNLPLPEPFINFGWQPYGEKFCVLTGNQAKATPLVYRIEANSHAPKLMSKLDAGVQFNEVSWAPAGGWLAVLAKRSTGGNVMFVDTTLQEAKRTNVVEHPGFNKGRELCRKGLERLSQFKWRPRPPVKLTDQKLKSSVKYVEGYEIAVGGCAGGVHGAFWRLVRVEPVSSETIQVTKPAPSQILHAALDLGAYTMQEIKNNLKKTAVRFEREDNEEKNRASQEVVEKRRKIMAAFDVIRQRNLKKIAAQRELRISLRDGVDTDNAEEQELVEEQIMVALDTQKTLAPLGEDELD
ncbi:hypothetical protein ANCDUO_10345 [Ancylostoma duodenale]|uniref:Translation initiation factor beta propellor-like domain-containing protein n=1 Tax=Ancylostoma duodenale TaxID=51022 RepID=A0A0C2GE38_9BILA|nr:hypothetical protein ANCDUO_10345 [Ancylostoma duodenale]